MQVVDVYTNVFKNGERYSGRVNVGIVKNGSVSKFIDRTESIFFLNVAARSFKTEEEAQQYVEERAQLIKENMKEFVDEVLNAHKTVFVRIESPKPIRTNNQKRFGVPAEKNRRGNLYVIERVYNELVHKDMTVEQFIEALIGNYDDAKINATDNSITLVFNRAINAEDASEVVKDIIDIVEEQEL